MVSNAIVPIGAKREFRITEPERGEFPANLGGAVEYTITHWLYSVMRIMGEALGTFLGGAGVAFYEQIEPEVMEIAGPVLDGLLEIEGMPEWYKAVIHKLKEGIGEGSIPIVSDLTAGSIGTATSTVISSLLSPVTYALNTRIRPGRPGPAELFAMKWRGKLDDATLLDWLTDEGLPDPAIAGYESVLHPRPGIGDLFDYYLRTTGSAEAARDEMLARGYLADDIDKLVELTKVIPGVSDLITMGVREAWRDDVAAKYGYDEDFPAEMAEWAKKQGLSREWATRYWRSHWTLPGPTMARDILWRRLMSDEDYKTLLRIADYPAAFREWMTKAAYAVWTRVDIRRMHALGIIRSREELESAYMDIGYRGKYLDGIVDFTIAYNMEEERTATKGEILDAYEMGRFTPAETRDALLGIGILDWVAEVLIARVDYAKDKKRANLVIGNTEKAYKNGKLSKSDVVARLAALPLPAGEIDARLEEWDLEIESAIAIPTKAELRDWYIDLEIDEAEYRDGLSARNVAADDIDHYVNDTKREAKEIADKEAEKAAKEQEDIREREIKTAADIMIADYRVDIAKAKVAIADIKLALAGEITPDQETTYSYQILELKAIIADLEQSIAETRSATISELAKE